MGRVTAGRGRNDRLLGQDRPAPSALNLPIPADRPAIHYSINLIVKTEHVLSQPLH